MPDRAAKSELAQKIWSGESAHDSEKAGSGAPEENVGIVRRYYDDVNVFRTAFPDIRFTFDQVLAEADRVAMRLSVTGTHRGTFNGIPATNKEVSFSGMAFVRLEGGKVVERWEIMDMPSVMRQLGAGPK